MKYYPPKSAIFHGRSRPPPNTWFLGPPSPHPKQRLKQFSHYITDTSWHCTGLLLSSPVCDNFTQNWTGESPVFNPLFILTSLRQLKDMVGTLPQTSMGELRCFPRLPSWLWRGYPIRTRPQCIWRLNVRSGFLNHLATYSWIMDRHTDRPHYSSNNTVHSCCV